MFSGESNTMMSTKLLKEDDFVIFVLVEAYATVQSKEVISFERTCSNRVNMQDVSTLKVFFSYKTVSFVTDEAVSYPCR